MYAPSYPARLRWPRLSGRSVRLRLTVLYGTLFVLCAAALLFLTNALGGSWSYAVSSSGARRSGAAAVRAAGPAQASGRGAPFPVANDVAHGIIAHQFMLASIVAIGIMTVLAFALGWLLAGRILRPLRAITAATQQISEDDLHRRLAMPGPGNELKDLADTIDGLLARLQTAFDAQRNFVANASHELRTPLTLERAMLEVALADPGASAEELRNTCERVLAVGQQQEQLIEALLTLARSQRGLDRREPADLGAITASVLRSREPAAAAHGLTITAAISTTPVRGDARLLERLAANLIDNAIRHNIPRGGIDIQVGADDGGPCLKITNTGPVIPADQAGRLLEPFQRLSRSRAAPGSGLGLGLSIVAAIAKAHDATLTLTPGQQGGLDVEIGLAPAFTPAAVTPAAREPLLASSS